MFRVITLLLYFFISSSAKISLALVGDIAVSPKNFPVKKIFSHVTPFLKSVDLCIGNLEGAICSNAHIPRKKGKLSFNFRMDPSFAPALAAAGFDTLNLANNHSLDYGYSGLTETIRHLQNAQLSISGKNLNQRN